LPDDGPGLRRTGDSLEVDSPEVLQIVERAQQSSRIVGDDDGVRLGHRLQPSSEIRRGADDAELLGCSRSQEVADDHDPGGDPDPYAQR